MPGNDRRRQTDGRFARKEKAKTLYNLGDKYVLYTPGITQLCMLLYYWANKMMMVIMMMMMDHSRASSKDAVQLSSLRYSKTPSVCSAASTSSSITRMRGSAIRCVRSQC